MNQTKQDKLDKIYLDIAKLFASMSEAEKLKVGAIAVKDKRIISTGWNGTPSGWHTNKCEEKTVIYPEGFLSPEEYLEMGYHIDNDEIYRYDTYPEVLHAEQNLLCKVAKSTDSLENSDVYCTHSPCSNCAKLLAQSGINSFTYIDDYKDLFGRNLLEQLGVKVRKIRE